MTTEKDRNLRIAHAVQHECAWDGRTLQEGDFVALLDGEIIAVADTADEAIVTLRARDPDPTRGMVIEVSTPTVDVIRQVR